MKIGHISDLHWLETRGSHVSDYLNKRISGGINLLAGRSRTHTHEAVLCALETLRSQGCEHLVVTGDLTNLALPGEFQSVKAALNRYFSDDEMTIVPGNHDFYTRESASAKRFESIMYADAAPGNIETECAETWPFVRLRGDIAFIGLNSAQPRPWFVAAGRIGEAQRKALKRILDLPQIRSAFKIAALHHHLFRVLQAPGESLRWLDDRQALIDICSEGHVDLILHGHNHDYVCQDFHGCLVCEAGSCSVSKFKSDRRAGKFNIYTIENRHLLKIETWRYENHRYKLWQTREF